ncbi:g1613 [Coccomyxa viridis]|uniref:G1613 protein n=1 Tax=Coccomyxa viridis TaxID=1274662 RepID=A0ABP1FM91_9CHLO
MVYSDPPWVFKGRALYQLHLVKAEEAKKYIPDSFKIVSLFGYTIGGFYLARYSDSPVGSFDELVALAGLVWNPPTSCAWAARVYVNNREARSHGRKHCGLPSRVCSFADITSSPSKSRRKPPSWWHQGDSEAEERSRAGHRITLYNEERRSWLQPWKSSSQGLDAPVCSMVLPPALSEAWAGPRIRMQLPSFSGATAECPQLLQYTCQLCTNVRAVPAAIVEASSSGDSKEALPGILGGRPLLALAFDNMEMKVNKPAVVSVTRNRSEEETAMQPALAWAMAN